MQAIERAEDDGGASDVRLVSGEGNWDDFEGLCTRIIVAGGGGGSGYGSGNGQLSGYAGGGYSGNGTNAGQQIPNTSGNGSFGKGGEGEILYNNGLLKENVWCGGRRRRLLWRCWWNRGI